MNINQLYYIIEVAKTNSISKAAENLGMSQSGLSQAIQNIEKILGFKIFNRTNAGTLLTKEGIIIVQHANVIIDDYQKKEGEINNLYTQRRDVFRLAASNEISLPFLNALLLIQDKYPDFVVELVQTTPDLVLESVKDKQYDAGFIIYSRLASNFLANLKVDNIFTGRPHIYITEKHYFYDKEEPIPIALLLEQKYGRLTVPLHTDNLYVINEFIRKFQTVTILRDLRLENSIYQELK